MFSGLMPFLYTFDFGLEITEMKKHQTYILVDGHLPIQNIFVCFTENLNVDE